MKVQVNGKPTDLSKATHLEEVVVELGYDPQAVAVAKNLQFVPRPERAATIVEEGDAIEILHPQQGG